MNFEERNSSTGIVALVRAFSSSKGQFKMVNQMSMIIFARECATCSNHA